MAEGGGLEPPLPDPESGVLPLDDPSNSLINLISQVNIFYLKFLILKSTFKNFLSLLIYQLFAKGVD